MRNADRSWNVTGARNIAEAGSETLQEPGTLYGGNVRSVAGATNVAEASRSDAGRSRSPAGATNAAKAGSLSLKKPRALQRLVQKRCQSLECCRGRVRNVAGAKSAAKAGLG